MRAHVSRNVAVVLGRLLMALALGALSFASPFLGKPNSATSQQPITPPPLDKSKITVYVSDFELHAAPNGQPRSSAANPTSGPNSAAPIQNTPEQHAHLIIDLLSTGIIAALQQQGFHASRLASARPATGVLLRGVFAESDELNHVRRAILGSGSPIPRFVIFVAAQNLAKPEQTFYQLVDPKTPGVTSDETRFGPVITVSSYAPAAKYDLSKDPTPDDIKRLASQIAAGVSTLLQANPAALNAF